ncbi:hypothetical protein [Nocardioides luteus]|uniref:DUF5134 domain-containing protein n=1 Tax=Nocardioides luteus TaxID=1844 RepID=A0A1J4N0E3_9ACTN|nr:hypothetical protein [Nocardioides luteus]OIJ25076.1 hypothetical protein UG56_019360 [Nocardioides luteus]
MTALVVLSMVPAVVGAGCCAAGAGRRACPGGVDVSALGAMALMLVAMADTMLLGMGGMGGTVGRSAVLPATSWALVLGVLGAGLVATRRVHPDRLPRGLHLIAMAALAVAMAPPGLEHHLNHSAGAHAQMAGGGPVAPVAVVVAGAFLAYAVREGCCDRTPLLGRLELGASSVSLVAMAAMCVR